MTAERQTAHRDALGRKPETILEIDLGYDFEVAIVDDGFPRPEDLIGKRDIAIPGEQRLGALHASIASPHDTAA